MPMTLALLLFAATTPAPAVVDLDKAYATAAERAASADERGVVPFQELEAGAAAAFINCCLDGCLNVGCPICTDVYKSAVPAAWRPALDGMLYGAGLGCLGGAVLGLILALIFGAVSFGLSVSAGATTDAQTSAFVTSFTLTWMVVVLLATAVGAPAGLVGGILFLEPPGGKVAPSAKKGSRPDRRRRGGRWEDEIPPADPEPAPEPLPEPNTPDPADDDSPPGDAPPPPSVRY